MRSDLPTGTVTFLFTDIEGSTRLLHELGPDEYAAALAEHRRLLREACAQHEGVEVDTQGDALFVAFPTAEGAAAAAASATASLTQGPIRVRMGLHTGAPTLVEEGYVGVDVHRGARVAALAHGGQAVVSPTTAALLARPLRDLGLHRLKDFEGATRLFQLGDEEFPPLRTPGSVELPVPATRFVGRERELFDAVSLVYERDPRVLSILGPGGTGKTRFALELARLLSDEAEGGTVFVPLAPLADPVLALAAIAERLGATSPSPESIATRVGQRRTLVVVDNLEHLLPGLARPLGEVIEAAPELRLVATSREPLRVRGEVELDLPPLEAGEAIALFVERAHAVRPDLEATPAVRELCARLDRLPLALELAAARTKLLAPEALLERLGNRLDLLKGTRDAEERHATLRATIAWSYDLLDDDERRLFARLGVFRGGCTIDAAETVCDADVDTLASLLDKSLVRRRLDRDGGDRFWMLETMREFAVEQLVSSGEGDTVHRRHAKWVLGLAEAAGLWVESNLPFRYELILPERENVRAALDWTVDLDPDLGLSIAILLENFWVSHSAAEGERRTTALLEAAGGDVDPPVRAKALRVLGSAATIAGDLPRGEQAYEESKALYEEIGDELGAAIIEQRTASVHSFDWDPEDVRSASEHALAVFTEHGFDHGVLQVQGILASVAERTGDREAALGLHRESLEGARAAGFIWWEAIQLAAIARLEHGSGRLEHALSAAREALPLARRSENHQHGAALLARIALIHLDTGDLGAAGLLWGAAAREEARNTWALSAEATARLGGDDLGPAFDAGVAQGRELELWDAVSVALEGADQTVP